MSNSAPRSKAGLAAMAAVALRRGGKNIIIDYRTAVVPRVERSVPSHAVVLELQGTGGTNRFHQRLFVARLVGLIFMQAME
jgi:hypothetical protein